MCAGWALAGCDFCNITGLKASLVMDAMPSYLKTAKDLSQLMNNSWSGDREASKSVLPALRRLVLMCAGSYSDQPRARKKTVEELRNHDKFTLLRGAWVMAYWSRVEFAGNLADFGFTAIYDKQPKHKTLPIPIVTSMDLAP